MSLADMERLFDGIALGDITTSMTINSPAPMIFAMYLVVAEQQGADWKTISGTIQNDILKEFIAQKEYIFPPRPSMRLITDIFAFCAREVPRWNTISVSGYHIREAGSTALQELAFTLRDGIEYVQYGVDAGLDVDDFVPRMSFFFNSHSDFFEEIAKFRAARKLWAEAMRDRFGAKNPRSWKLRFHTQTAGVSLTAQQPYNNVVRTALQALAAVLGGTNSLHTNSLDEALALPTEEAATHRAAHAADHRARERRHQRRRPARRVVLRRGADARHGARARCKYWDTIDRMGGMVEAIERGYPAEGDRRGVVPVPAGGRAQGEGHRRRQRLRAGRTSRRSRSSTSTTRPRRSSWRGSRPTQGARATTAPCAARSTRCTKTAARHRQHDGAAARLRARLLPPSARCATPCARSGASGKRRRSSRRGSGPEFRGSNHLLRRRRWREL